MIRLQEIYDDMDARRPVRIETGRQNIATIRQLVHWAKENNKTNMLNEELIRQALLTIPYLVKEFIKDTGCALRIDDIGIIKVRYREGRLSLLLRNDKALYEDLENVTCQIDKYYAAPDGSKVRFGGRMAKPKELMPMK